MLAFLSSMVTDTDERHQQDGWTPAGKEPLTFVIFWNGSIALYYRSGTALVLFVYCDSVHPLITWVSLIFLICLYLDSSR